MDPALKRALKYILASSVIFVADNASYFLLVVTIFVYFWFIAAYFEFFFLRMLLFRDF